MLTSIEDQLLERVPNAGQRPRPEEKLVLNKTSTRYYPGLNFGKACEPSAGLDKALG